MLEKERQKEDGMDKLKWETGNEINYIPSEQ